MLGFFNLILMGFDALVFYHGHHPFVGALGCDMTSPLTTKALSHGSLIRDGITRCWGVSLWNGKVRWGGFCGLGSTLGVVILG